MFAKNAIRAIVLFIGALVLSLTTTAGARTQNALDVASIDAYIENPYS
jgi:hypothetical protein